MSGGSEYGGAQQLAPREFGESRVKGLRRSP